MDGLPGRAGPKGNPGFGIPGPRGQQGEEGHYQFTFAIVTFECAFSDQAITIEQ